MATATESPIATTSSPETVKDLLDRLGGITPGRVRIKPWPGLATEGDLIGVNGRKQGIRELVEGALVERPMGLVESMLAGSILAVLRSFVIARNLGFVTAPRG